MSSIEPTADSRRRVILAGLVGNVMEWYDFAVYGYFATVIGHHFFPSTNPSVSLIAAFGAFAAGFLVRPLGGLLFGRIGDLVGRKRAMILSVIAMAVPTVFIGLLPTYAMIGIAAPILIVVLRIVQGLSVGGEYTSSLVFLTEHAKPGKRARTAIWGLWGAVGGILLGSGIGAIATDLLTADQIMAWGWRIPFLLGAFVALTGFLVRRTLHAEAPSVGSAKPVKDTFGKHRWAVTKVILLNVGNGVSFYAAFIYAVTYIKTIDQLPEGLALNLNTAAMALLLILLPFTAWLSDKFGRRPLMILGALVIAGGAVPFFLLMHTVHPMMIFAGELGFVIGFALLNGGIVAANVELMPAEIRCTGLAFAYNASIGFFGGTTPLIAAWLITSTSNPIAPAYWIAIAGTISLITAVFLIKETSSWEFA